MISTIRPIVPADASAAASLSAQFGYPVEAAVMEQRIAALSGHHAAFVAERAGVIVGWIDLAVTSHLQSGDYVEIGGLVVAEETRGQGIGALLVRFAENWARNQGIHRVVVRSQIARDGAHRFYLREGYVRTKTSAVFSKEL